MPLESVPATHIRATCHGCGVDAIVCCNHQAAGDARPVATSRFKRAGWEHDAATGGRSRGSDYAETNGEGRWYCPTCTRAKHL